MGFRNALSALLLIAAGCGGSPTSSTSLAAGLPFHTGPYQISFLGGSSECGDVKNPQAGTSITVRFDMRADAAGWTATSTNGTLTLHFQRGASPSAMASLPIAGTGRGFADDQGIQLGAPVVIPPNGTRLTIEGMISLSGGMPSGFVSDFSQGTLDGIVVFSRNGVTSTCPPGAVGWTLNRLPS